ncbi:Hypp9117 [Branchiostoma lanceolatum]|uniref:Hypp9117 protein n=1 Tax=Branchiostoma lanceolatum TaxID=7740 RepID=A0A8J9ZDI0_BRALA|nr:Hypp9117 [Branchiostoma lanceolatum]
MEDSTGSSDIPPAWDNWYVAYLLILLCVLKSIESIMLLFTPVDAAMVGPNRQDQQWVPYHDRPVAALFNYMYRQLE